MLTQLSPTLEPKQTTAFTSLLMGVFLNNNSIISISGLSKVTEKGIYQRYGQPFLHALSTFADYSTLEQVYVINSLQRYTFFLR